MKLYDVAIVLNKNTKVVLKLKMYGMWFSVSRYLDCLLEYDKANELLGMYVKNMSVVDNCLEITLIGGIEEEEGA